jgi:hypothetical protein
MRFQQYFVGYFTVIIFLIISQLLLSLRAFCENYIDN